MFTFEYTITEHIWIKTITEHIVDEWTELPEFYIWTKTQFTEHIVDKWTQQPVFYIR